MLAVAPVPRRSRPATTPRSRRSASWAASSSAKARPACSSRSAPAGVVKARLPTRSSRAVPQRASSWRMWRLTAGGLKRRLSAARDKLPCRAISRKVRTWVGFRSIAWESIPYRLHENNLFPLLTCRGQTAGQEGTTLMGDVSIRAATPEDAAAICTIYNQGIEDRIATLETELRTPEERRQWMATRAARHPVVVAGSGGQVVGWGSLNSFNPRPAYDNVVDLSVYVERAWRGRGVGRALLEHLLPLATSLGYHKMVLATFPYNEAGVALDRRMGFRPVGVYREEGRLDGRWVDGLIMERLL